MKNIFITQTFLVDDSREVACLLLGYRAKIKNYKQMITDLQKEGYCVIAYEFNPRVLNNGDPEDLAALVDGIIEDFKTKSIKYEKLICIGLSVGAGIGFKVQKAIPHVKYGVYAVAGVSPSRNIFEAPLFFFVRRKFKKKGIDATELRRHWQDYEISAERPPAKSAPFVMLLGKRDKIVQYDQAVVTLEAWRSAGVPIKIITKSKLAHTSGIIYFKKHIKSMLKFAADFE